MQPTPANPICTDYITVALAVSGNVPAASGEPRKRGSVERCRRDRERFANPHYHVSDSDPFSLTAPARREADATAQLHKQNPG